MGSLPDVMQPDLASFLAHLMPVAEEEVVWGRGSIRLRSVCYFGSEIPPLTYITSVRSIVIRGERVLVLRNPDETHIMPGGRREAGETLEQTMRREVLEETGWELQPVTVLGFIHFHHLTLKPPEHPYPYPDFLHLIYVSLATSERPEARIPDDYERECAFHTITDMMDAKADGAAANAIGANQRLYLRAALASLADKGLNLGDASTQGSD